MLKNMIMIHQRNIYRIQRIFLGKSSKSTTQIFVSNEGTYFRYDNAINGFGIINQYGGHQHISNRQMELITG